MQIFIYDNLIVVKIMKEKYEPIFFYIHVSKTGGTTFIGHIYQFLDFDEELIDLGNWGRPFRKKHGKEEIFDRTSYEKQKVKIISGHEVFYGIHEHFPEREPRYIIFLREPSERLVSKYNHEMTLNELRGEEITKFDEWIDEQPQNEMTLFCNKKYCNGYEKFEGVGRVGIKKESCEPVLEDAVRLLEDCWFVGVTQNLDQDLPYLFRTMDLQMGWQNRRVSGESKSSISDLGLPYDVNHKKFIEPSQLSKEVKEHIAGCNSIDYALYKKAIEINSSLRNVADNIQ